MQDLINIEATQELCDALELALHALKHAERIVKTPECATTFGQAHDELALLLAGIRTNAAYRRHRAARSSDPAS